MVPHFEVELSQPVAVDLPPEGERFRLGEIDARRAIVERQEVRLAGLERRHDGESTFARVQGEGRTTAPPGERFGIAQAERRREHGLRRKVGNCRQSEYQHDDGTS